MDSGPVAGFTVVIRVPAAAAPSAARRIFAVIDAVVLGLTTKISRDGAAMPCCLSRRWPGPPRFQHGTFEVDFNHRGEVTSWRSTSRIGKPSGWPPKWRPSRARARLERSRWPSRNGGPGWLFAEASGTATSNSCVFSKRRYGPRSPAPSGGARRASGSGNRFSASGRGAYDRRCVGTRGDRPPRAGLGGARRRTRREPVRRRRADSGRGWPGADRKTRPARPESPRPARPGGAHRRGAFHRRALADRDPGVREVRQGPPSRRAELRRLSHLCRGQPGRPAAPLRRRGLCQNRSAPRLTTRPGFAVATRTEEGSSVALVGSQGADALAPGARRAWLRCRVRIMSRETRITPSDTAVVTVPSA